jgi:hypothetical protein
VTPRQAAVAQKQLDAIRAQRGDVSEVTIGRRKLVDGVVCTFTGVRGEFTFHSARVVDGVCQWLTVCGGTRNHRAWRHFTPGRLKSVKRKLAEP